MFELLIIYMNNCQFKFKPDKIKYLSNIDTLDSTHKKTIESINKKHDDLPKKEKRLEKLKNDLIIIDSNSSTTSNYICIRAKMIDDINRLEEEINQTNNYDDELEYYSKTYDILFNYYNIIDGMNPKEIEQINNKLKESDLISNIEQSNTIDIKSEIINNTEDNIQDNIEDNIENNTENNTENNRENNRENNIKTSDDKIWDFDGIEIFNNKSNKLDLLNQISKMKRKEKKVTRKRVKNVESLIKDNNNIFDYIEGNKSQNSNSNQINSNQTKAPIIYDRATLYEDYKIMIEGYSSKKKISKPCINCGIDKILIYNEGIYACMKCGEVENCIIESEVTNYKDPMVEKPTFPYKRKNHFCEWTEKYNCSLKLIIKKLANIIYSYKILL